MQHQHGQWQHHRDAGQRVGAQAAHDVAVEADDDGVGEQAQNVGRGQAHQRGQHRAVQHALAGVGGPGGRGGVGGGGGGGAHGQAGR